MAAGLIRRGRLVAIKGLGGYHLAVDALHEPAVAALRSRKHREEKPFAFTVPGVETARVLADVEPAEERLPVSRDRSCSCGGGPMRVSPRV